jgi:hypothetical protein
VIVQKAIYINPVEPAVLNVRAPMGMETKLDVTFYAQTGTVHNQDLGAQLQLTSRSGSQTSYYTMPAIDVANGKARALIPADFMTDTNGYRLRITGTLNSEPALLAIGTLYPLAAAGIDAVPQDLIDTIDLTLTKGRIAEVGVKLWDDEGKSDPYELDTTTISSNVYESRGGAILVPFAVTAVSSNEVLLTLTIEEVGALPPTCWWTLVASNSSGANTLCEGTITVREAP